MPIEPGSQIELTLPLRLNNGDRGSDFLRVREGLITSINRFCDPAFVRRLAIIVPEADVEASSELSIGCTIPIEIISETELLPIAKIGNIPRRGWFIQQMLKLAFSKVCKTEFYVTLDADVFLIKPLNFAVLRDGLVPAQYEPVSAHRGWWEASAQVLNADVSAITFDENRAFGVTPAFLKSSIVRELLDRVDEIGSGDWVDYLCSRTNLQNHCWTEYSLYWTYVINKYDPDKIYFGYPVYLYTHYTWQAWQTISDRTMSYAQLFCIIQSSQVNDKDFTDLVAKFLSPPL